MRMKKVKMVYLKEGKLDFRDIPEETYRRAAERLKTVVLAGLVKGDLKKVEMPPEVYFVLMQLADATGLSITEIVRNIHACAMKKGEEAPSKETVLEYIRTLVN